MNGGNVSPLPKLPPLLLGESGQPIRTLDEWNDRRRELLEGWHEFLGPPAVERVDSPRFEILDSEELPDVVRMRIRYRVEPGCHVEAYLLKPIGVNAPAPGVIAFHSTVPETIRQPAGVEGEPEKAFGLQLARRGYVTLCPRCFLWANGDRRFFWWHARRQVWRLRKRLGPVMGMAKMLHDARVGLDLLCGLPEVDAGRIGAVGHSLGAKQVLYLAALDDRVRVAVSSEGGIGRTFSNWSAPWYLGRDRWRYLGRDRRLEDRRREHHELLGLVAPRAFLLIGGDSADGERSLPFIEEARTVYRLFGQPERIGLYNHRQGHCVPADAGREIDQWFGRYL